MRSEVRCVLLALLCVALVSAVHVDHGRRKVGKLHHRRNGDRKLSTEEVAKLVSALPAAIKADRYGYSATADPLTGKDVTGAKAKGEGTVVSVGPSLSTLRVDIDFKTSSGDSCFTVGLPFNPDAELALIATEETMPTIYDACVAAPPNDNEDDAEITGDAIEDNVNPAQAASSSSSSSSSSSNELPAEDEEADLKDLLAVDDEPVAAAAAPVAAAPPPKPAAAGQNAANAANAGLPVSYHYSQNANPVFKRCTFASRLQGLCFACWAFASSRVWAINQCIQTRGKIKVRPSIQQLLSCSKSNGHGIVCNGGDAETDTVPTWRDNGIVPEPYLPYTAKFGKDISRKTPRSWCKATATKKPFSRYQLFEFNDDAFMEHRVKGKAPTAQQVTYVKNFLKDTGVVVGNLEYHATTIEGWTKKKGKEYFITSDTWTLNPLYYKTSKRSHKRKLKTFPVEKFVGFQFFLPLPIRWKVKPYKVTGVTQVNPTTIRVQWEAPIHPGRMSDILRVADLELSTSANLQRSRDQYIGFVVVPGTTNSPTNADFEAKESTITLKTPLVAGKKYEVRFCLRTSLQWVATAEFTAN